jgi:hypothetical protein
VLERVQRSGPPVDLELPGDECRGADCGTYAGYRWHNRNGDTSCEPCRAAAAAYGRNRKRAPAA